MSRQILVWSLIAVLLLIAAVALPQWWMSKRLEAAMPVAPTVTTKAERSAEAAKAPTVYYPMTRYQERASVRTYGRLVVPGDNKSFSCGDEFSGYHTGDDLEMLEGEKNIEVPVFAIADGTVRQIANINGYGGLVVVEHVLDGQTVTAYYGHVDINQTTGAVGDSVTAGQRLVYLGDDCSSETSGERKHMHFSIRTGAAIDVHGYIPTEEELKNWQSPLELFKRLNAAQPKP